MTTVPSRLRARALAATILLALAACAKHHDSRPTGEIVPQGTDLLAGAGTFDDAGLWFLQGPDGAALEVAPCDGFDGACATITGAGGEPGAHDYDAQLIHWDAAAVAPRFVNLQTTKKYTIALRASASAAGTPIRIALLDDAYGELGSSSFTLGTAPEVHVGTAFQLAGANGASGALRVSLGGPANAGATVRIDDLQVIEQDAGETPPPSGTDLLAGAGSFDTAAQQGQWWLNVPSQGTGSTAATLTFPTCAAPLAGSCAEVASPDYGGDSWHTQVVWGASGALGTLTLDETKTYRILYEGKVASPDGQPRSFSIWLQHGSDWPPALQYTGTLTTAAGSYDSGPLTLDATYVTGGTVQVDFVINLGPDASNGGATFTFDDIRLLER